MSRIFGFIRAHPWASLFAVLGFMASASVAPLLQLRWNTSHPEGVEIQNVKLERLPDKGFLLTVRISAPAIPDCLRISQHILTRSLPGHEPDGNVPLFVPLGSALSGLGFTPDSLPSIGVVLKIHPFTAAGRWYYIDRSAYLCVEEPGLVGMKQVMSKPYPIDIPE